MIKFDMIREMDAEVFKKKVRAFISSELIVVDQISFSMTNAGEHVAYIVFR